MKEAAKTSVISRRWQKLWTSYPCLHFDGSQALLKLWEKVYEYWVCKLKKIFDIGMARYVNIILKSCHLFGAAIDEFITLCLPSSSSLTSLILKQVNVSGEVLANFISNSPFLECLCAGGSRSLVHMRLVGPPLYLKHLEIIRCDHMESLEIDAANLLSLKYLRQKIKIPSMNVPNLANSWDVNSFLSDPKACTQYYIKWMKKYEYPILSRLEQLELSLFADDDESLLILSSLINACPVSYMLSLE
ncbi:hypothetical protein Golob_024679, partial [Gossypium lobatum]|nr:hypothetical protein [Gossypium lobatum]